MQNDLTSCLLLAIVTIYFFGVKVLAKDLPSQFLPHSSVAEPVLIDTQDAVVESNGHKFRQIDYKGDKYLVTYLERDKTHDDEPICVRELAEEIPKVMETYREITPPQSSRHRETFVQGLKMRCQKMRAPTTFELGLRTPLNQSEKKSGTTEATANDQLHARFRADADSNDSSGISTRDRMKREINTPGDKPVFGPPGNKNAGIPF